MLPGSIDHSPYAVRYPNDRLGATITMIGLLAAALASVAMLLSVVR
jgi:hypothetical protein